MLLSLELWYDWALCCLLPACFSARCDHLRSAYCYLCGCVVFGLFVASILDDSVLEARAQTA